MPKRILVVDDDRNIGQILHASFSSKGYETIVSRNGEDALAKFSQIQPDLVLLDVLLPRMNGWDVCKKLKETEAGRNTPIILMSAVYKNYKMQQDAREKYGADDFVEKPFQLSRLLDKVSGLLGPGEAGAVVTEDADEEIDEAPMVEKAVSQVSLEGDFSTMGFAEILHAVYVMAKSGYLLVKNDDAEKEVAVKEGYPVSVRTTLEDEYFGNFLVRKRKISPEERDESVKRMKESNRLQGTILIEMGALTPHELVRFLRMQMREKLFEIFRWREGVFKFTENRDVQGDITTLDMSTANVISMGVEEHFDLDRLMPIIDEWRGKYLRPGSNLHYRYQDVELTQRERAIFEEIDGQHKVDEVLNALDIELERAYQIIYTLIVTEMVELIDAPLDKPELLVVETDEQPAPVAPPKAAPAAPPKAAPATPPKAAPAPVAPKPAAAPKPVEPAPVKEAEPEVEELDEEEPAAEPEEAADAEIRKKVRDVYARVTDGNYFHVLGVGENPTEHEVRLAYHRMAKEFHPDRFFGLASPEIKAQVEEIFRLAAKAYEELNTQEKIAQYKDKLAGEEEGPKTDVRIEGVKKIIIAEQNFQNGKQYMKEKRYARAAFEFRKAMEITSNEAEYIAHYGWAMYNIPYEEGISEEDAKLFQGESPSDLQFQGREALNRAITINPRSEKAYLFLGSIYKTQGLKEFAEKQYEKALICNPNCIEALRELRLIKLEEQKKAKKKSFIERLLGR